VIVQGDEPLFFPEVIKNLIQPILSDSQVRCTNLLSLINDREDLKDVDIVKAVVGRDSNIMYFSRSPIPYFRNNIQAPCYRQTGISAFTREFLSVYIGLTPTLLEEAESIDFLRIIEQGYDIRAVVVDQATYGVDREDDIRIIEGLIRKDPVQAAYYQRIIKL
jgi:3-deoxy-manno-octulosonate cytidylyltransferase (CMP-KDO synthetase)